MIFSIVKPSSRSTSATSEGSGKDPGRDYEFGVGGLLIGECVKLEAVFLINYTTARVQHPSRSRHEYCFSL